jgi:hypothetical protein
MPDDKPRRRSLARSVFVWTLVLFAAMLGALLLLSLGNPDQPFSYVLQ